MIGKGCYELIEESGEVGEVGVKQNVSRGRCETNVSPLLHVARDAHGLVAMLRERVCDGFNQWAIGVVGMVVDGEVGAHNKAVSGVRYQVSRCQAEWGEG